ncbi:lariat debranching enzyme, C-terminal domain-containing protein [Limtongia smithiae]|uniref:lariat debranching enzyme, C-terminal domain-containing protein n=1 Tax=Limtongia smithiae TaxID=1125753 RepID=UPI0034CEA70A
MLNIAFEGCCHSELDKIYRAVSQLNKRVDLLIIGGDFQAARNIRDVNCMSIPPKYRRLGDFAEYYSGRKTAPLLTLFIGGNHEASNYMWELYYGGWVAKNIYYLGAAGVVNIGGVRIGGLSGIWNSRDYFKGHYERLPYNERTKRSIYHIRQYDVLKLYQLSGNVDVMLSHDWPAGIEHHGDLAELLRKKEFFRNDIKNHELGSPPAMALLKKIKPRWWLSAHLHVRFPGVVRHEEGEVRTEEVKAEGGEKVENSDEIVLDDMDFDTDEVASPAAPPVASDPVPSATAAITEPHGFAETRFLALDKCLPRRQFLELLTLPTPPSTPSTTSLAPLTISYDPDWLAITKATAPSFSTDEDAPELCATPEERLALRERIERARAWVEEHIVAKGKLTVPDNFEVSAKPGYHGEEKSKNAKYPPREYKNTQTQAFCELLGIENRIALSKTTARSPSPSPAII